MLKPMTARTYLKTGVLLWGLFAKFNLQKGPATNGYGSHHGLWWQVVQS
jgi:hypothetical protein